MNRLASEIRTDPVGFWLRAGIAGLSVLFVAHLAVCMWGGA